MEDIAVKKEPVFCLMQVKKEEKYDNECVENNELVKKEFDEEIKQDCSLHECVKQEASFQYYTDKLEKSQQDPVAINNVDIKCLKEEYLYINDIKDETLKEDCKYEFATYKIDIEESKMEPSFNNDHPSTSISENSISDKSNLGGQVSVTGLKVHKQAKTYKCMVCFKLFNTHKNLKNHIDSIHKGIKYKCNECHKMYSFASSLKKHTISIHKGMKYKCNECHKMYSFASSLKKHTISIHKGIKYKCNDCHKMFSDASNLKKHTNSMHKGIKYKCNECHKMFSNAATLKTHTDCVHKGIKYKCNECHKMFSNTSSLKKHTDYIHKRIKYECNRCHKKFSKIHTQNTYQHAPDLKYYCSYCQKVLSIIQHKNT